MTAIASLLLVLAFSVLVTRFATSILTLSGVSRELAHFQARSAYTGVGYTTDEAERIVNHPVRRRVVLTLMLLGNAGVATIVATFILGFVGIEEGGEALSRFGVLAGGVIVLIIVTRVDRLNILLDGAIQWALDRFTDLEARDFEALLNIAGEYSVNEINIAEDSWLVSGPLHDLELIGEGVLILGVQRSSGQFLGAPSGDTELHTGDSVIVYGREDQLRELSERQPGGAGDRAARQAREEHERRRREETTRDEIARERAAGELDDRAAGADGERGAGDGDRRERGLDGGGAPGSRSEGVPDDPAGDPTAQPEPRTEAVAGDRTTEFE